MEGLSADLSHVTGLDDNLIGRHPTGFISVVAEMLTLQIHQLRSRPNVKIQQRQEPCWKLS